MNDKMLSFNENSGFGIVGTVTGGTGFVDIELNSDGIAEVQDWIDNPSTNYGIIITNPTNTNGLDISSRETTTATREPKLTINYIATDWHANQTNSLTGKSNSTTFDLTLENESTYEWNCLVYDQVGNSDWADENES